MRYNTPLWLSHFQDPLFRQITREIFRGFVEMHPDYPDGREIAKVWETVQGWRGLRDHGAIHDGAELLGVGAGSEPLVFWLTSHVGRVFATDLYETNSVWQEAAPTMLTDPGALCPAFMPFNRRRLVVQHMNALDLQYEDDSFDGIFSCGSIEHFGSLENVARASAEMGRVLKPGGVLTLSTEFRLRGPDELGIAGAIMFTRDMIMESIVKPSGLEPTDEFARPDDGLLQFAYPLLEAIENGLRSRSVCLSHDGFDFTSACVCLRKPLRQH